MNHLISRNFYGKYLQKFREIDLIDFMQFHECVQAWNNYVPCEYNFLKHLFQPKFLQHLHRYEQRNQYYQVRIHPYVFDGK